MDGPPESDILLTTSDSNKKAFTNRTPFYNDPPDAISSAIEDGKRSARPTHSTLTDWLWELTQQCWDPEASQRPQVSQVLEVLNHLSVSILGHAPIGLTGFLAKWPLGMEPFDHLSAHDT